MHIFKKKSSQELLNQLNMAHAKLIEVHYLVAQRHTIDDGLKTKILSLEERFRDLKSPAQASNPSHSKIQTAIKECGYLIKMLYKFNEKQPTPPLNSSLSASDFAINEAKLNRANTGEFPNPITMPRRI